MVLRHLWRATAFQGCVSVWKEVVANDVVYLVKLPLATQLAFHIGVPGQVRGQDRAPCSCPQPGPDLAAVAI